MITEQRVRLLKEKDKESSCLLEPISCGDSGFCRASNIILAVKKIQIILALKKRRLLIKFCR